jgi:nudix-type nucleoside diphosphatase (YffH/AdpP family)
VLIRPDGAARARLDAYELAFGYGVRTVRVQTARGPVDAALYVPRAGLWAAGRVWSLDDWVTRHGALTVEVAAEVMTLLPETTPEAIRHRYGMLQTYVASRRRARATQAPAEVRRQSAIDDLDILSRSHPYTWFFGVAERDLRFRRFDGSYSAPVNRAAFLMGDAVTVLPYDPVRDMVMLVEQFRFGPYMRGDANPWTLEPIAGRIDPGESPEAAGRREAREEARLDMAVLHPVSRYYVSPGAVTEYLYSYVGLADLPAQAAGVSGLATEHEDIRAHVLPFARALDMVASGEIENAPLLISVQWLAMNRDRLRAEAGAAGQ